MLLVSELLPAVVVEWSSSRAQQIIKRIRDIITQPTLLYCANLTQCYRSFKQGLRSNAFTLTEILLY